MQNQSKMTYLEAARGIASVIVVLHHFSLAFMPWMKNELTGTPLYGFFNGNAAVLFFFTLSGFVLTYRFFLSPTPSYMVAASLKRLPRLMVPAGLSILIGCALMIAGLVFFAPAAALSGSEWLSDMGNARLPVPFHPSFLDAIAQSLKVFLLQSHFYYNSNLWTMRPEFFGSLVVFAVACVVFAPIGRLLQLAVLIGAALLFRVGLPVITPFIVGAALAFGLVRWDMGIITSRWAGLVLAIIAVLGFSSTYADVHIIASALIILGLVVTPGVAVHFSGRIGLLLGKISFPLYLVHTLVILSAASFVYVSLTPVSPALAIFVAFLTTVVGSAIALVPFVLLEGWWVPFLNRIVKGLQARLGAAVRQTRQEKAA